MNPIPPLPPQFTVAMGEQVRLLAWCRAVDEASAVTVQEAARRSVHHGPLLPAVVSRLQSRGWAKRGRAMRFGWDAVVCWLTPEGARLAQDLAGRDAGYAERGLPQPSSRK